MLTELRIVDVVAVLRTDVDVVEGAGNEIVVGIDGGRPDNNAVDTAVRGPGAAETRVLELLFLAGAVQLGEQRIEVDQRLVRGLELL